ncbi:MAG: hypothetical protein AMXMBFR64_00950 [Myxococcales bacterium]
MIGMVGMLAMIKINLLAAKTRKPVTGGRSVLALFLLLLLAEGAGLYVWYDAVDERVKAENAKIKDLEEKVAELNKVKAKMEEREQNKATLAKQNIVFEELKYDKAGPANMLLFLTYVVTKKEDNVYNQEEIKAQEDAGWDMSWDPDRLWITSFDEKDKEVSIKGRAISHEDVAQFYSRLSSSVYFYDVQPQVQERKFNTDLDVKFVEFAVDAKANYDTEGVPQVAAAAPK